MDPTHDASHKLKYADRLANELARFLAGEELSPKHLAAEYGVDVQAIQRDFNQRFAFLQLERKAGRYKLPASLVGKLSAPDIRRFAGLAGVSRLFPALSDDFLRELFDARLTDVLLVQGMQYEELGDKETTFRTLEAAISQHRMVSIYYQKEDGLKAYPLLQPYKLVNHDGIWYLAVNDGKQLKSFTVVKIETLELQDTTFGPDPTVHATLAKEDGIWLNKNKYEVVLKVSGIATSYFKRRKLVANQTLVKELEGGDLLISAFVAHHNQILPTVREWIPYIRIISPENLQADMERELRAYLGA